MAALTVADVVFELQQININVSPNLIRRIEWALGHVNYPGSEYRLIEKLSDFTLRNRRSTSKISLDDFLCENGVSIKDYRLLRQSINQSILLSTAALDELDADSNIITFAQQHPSPRAGHRGVTRRHRGLAQERTRRNLPGRMVDGAGKRKRAR